MQRMLRCLSPSTQAAEKVSIALEKVNRMAETSNADARVRQNTARMDKFAARLDGLDMSKIMSVGNEMIFERKVVVCVGKSSTKQKLHAALFHDYIVLAKDGKKDKLNFKFLIRLDLAHITEIHSVGSDSFPFEISLEDESKQKFVFHEGLEVSRGSWMKALVPLTGNEAGMLSARRASRSKDFRRRSTTFQSSPHPLIRSPGREELSPRVEKPPVRSKSAKNISQSPSASMSPEPSGIATKKTKNLKRMSIAAAPSSKLLQNIASGSPTMFPLISQEDILSKRAALNRRSDVPHRAVSVANAPLPPPLSAKPSPLVRGRSRSFGADINKIKVVSDVTYAVSSPRLDDIPAMSKLDDTSKMLVQRSLDVLYQTRSALSVGNTKDASDLLATLIQKLEELTPS